MKLIIAEKPSLGRAIMKALSTTGERFNSVNGGEYYVSQSYMATSQFGHLLELKMPEEYPENESKNFWDIQNIPFFPKNYLFKVRGDAEKRLNTIKALVARKDIDEIIHCGDPDREGQILVDLVLREVGNKKPVTRPQLKALTDDAIVNAIRIRRPNEEYKNIRNEGLARMYFDWDYGINLSRYATLKTFAKPALNIGRVVGAICSEIYDRDKAIENFVPEKYFKVQSDVDGLKLVSKNKFPFDEKLRAEDYANNLQAGDTIVESVETKPVKKQAPKLFSQTTLQAKMSKDYNLAPKETIDLAQSLYEKGLTTYPRTNTEYLAEDEKDTVRKIIDKINTKGLLEFKDKKSIFDNSKIDSHSAIIITGTSPGNNLTEKEMNCYKAILNRFRAVFCKEDCIYDKTDIILNNPIEIFKVSGEVLVKPGWQMFEPKKAGSNGDSEDDNNLPLLTVGQKVNTDFKAVEAETVPPKHYTVDTLGKWMQNPFRKEDTDDEDLYKNILAGLEIGTEATRAGILDKAISKEYIALKGKSYLILPRGEFLVESCRTLGIDMSKEKTAEMGKAIKDVSKGNLSIADVLNKERADVAKIISDNKAVAADNSSSGSADCGKCPICGGALTDCGVLIGCSNWKDDDSGCNFRLWKTFSGKKLSEKNLRDLLAKGVTESVVSGLKKKAGGTYDAKLRFKEDFSGLEPFFEERLPIGKCPRCGSAVKEGKDYYLCENKGNGCPFLIPKAIAGKRITPSHVMSLLNYGGTNIIRGFASKKTGKTFNASLRLKADKSGVEFNF